MTPEAQLGATVGTVLGGAYQITRLLGEGGMGWVYEARHLRLNKRVAVKLMARELAVNPEALARFHREAEITSQLGHPHLVSVLDFGATDAREPYIVMEYLDGEDLDQRIRREGRLPLSTAVAITKQVASALAAAHAEGVVHRDLKPGNVFLVKVRDEDDFVKVLDFGVSKIKASRTKLTRAASIIGTPEYMSPEQATGLIEDIDHRADQWALACIAWEMLSGYAPFVAEDMGALFYQLINMDPHPLARRAPGLPPAVEPALRRALAKRVSDRYPSIKDFSRAFEAAATGRQVDVTPPPILVGRPAGATTPPPVIRPRTPISHGTVVYGPAVQPVTTVRHPTVETVVAWGQPEVADEPIDARRQASPFDELADELPARRFKPFYLIPIAAAVVLILVGFLAWPSKQRPAPQAQSSTAPLPNLPEVVTLPARPPSPAPAPTPAPAPRATKPKPSKVGTLDDLMRGAAKAPAINAKKPSPYVDPFESDPVPARAAAPSATSKPAKPRPRALVEEL